MNKTRRITAVILTLVIIFTAFTTSTFAAGTQVNDQTEYLESVREIIRQKYNGQIPEEEMEKATTLKGIFDTLDDYSEFMTSEEFDAFVSSLSGSIEGIGIQPAILDKDKYATVIKVFRNTPAWEAGILTGDQIAEVDGESVEGQPAEDVTDRIQGIPGTRVKLGLIRQGFKDLVRVEVTRAEIDIPSVHYEIRGDIGYIQIDLFGENTYSGVDEALGYFDGKNITRVVLDLRNNGGGYVDQAVKVARRFVPEGLITTLDYKDEGVKDETYYSSLKKPRYKLAVLVNEYSASASEILTGAVKDTKAGVVVGTKTFGKAKVQTFTPILSFEAFESLNRDNEIKSADASNFIYMIDDTQLAGWGKMTTGLYYTPNGDCIDLEGIEPNVRVTAQEPAGSSVQVNLMEPLSLTVKPNLGAKYFDVYIAEHILKLLKYDVDEPDMILDNKTVQAIKKFQKDNKVYSYGVLDYCTQKLLNDRLAAMKVIKDPVYSKAAQLIK